MRPTLHVLEPSLPGRIVDEALTVLERTGVMIEDPQPSRAWRDRARR
jgi:hypothetical protein